MDPIMLAVVVRPKTRPFALASTDDTAIVLMDGYTPTINKP